MHVNQPLAHDLVVTLSNNAQVTIKAGETSAPYTHDAQGDDVYQDAGQISLGINSAVDATGATFENLELGGAASVKTEVKTQVTDEPGTPGVPDGNEGDLVLVTITADQTSVAENVKAAFTVHINCSAVSPWRPIRLCYRRVATAVGKGDGLCRARQ
ncbi:immunoglobulin-like domain-containing protein [Pseudomonas putida]|uniref:immunoglobulin-like domain-containing protein n=1 Tax=Pseudomonas putida TaxID=303 RepID=UPI0002D28178|nr:immunoglobulin-like domain-containing protein [Pseudomonas putida]